MRTGEREEKMMEQGRTEGRVERKTLKKTEAASQKTFPLENQDVSSSILL